MPLRYDPSGVIPIGDTPDAIKGFTEANISVDPGRVETVRLLLENVEPGEILHFVAEQGTAQFYNRYNIEGRPVSPQTPIVVDVWKTKDNYVYTQEYYPANFEERHRNFWDSLTTFIGFDDGNLGAWRPIKSLFAFNPYSWNYFFGEQAIKGVDDKGLTKTFQALERSTGIGGSDEIGSGHVSIRPIRVGITAAEILSGSQYGGSFAASDYGASAAEAYPALSAGLDAAPAIGAIGSVSTGFLLHEKFPALSHLFEGAALANIGSQVVGAKTFSTSKTLAGALSSLLSPTKSGSGAGGGSKIVGTAYKPYQESFSLLHYVALAAIAGLAIFLLVRK